MAEEIIGKLEQGVIDGETEVVEEWARKALEAHIDPVRAIEDGLVKGIKKVGDDFGKGILFLPDIVCAADAFKAGATILEEEINLKGGRWKAVGTLVIGTVQGDIHDIGKTLVATLFKASGFNVIDLGVDVTKEKFLDAIRTHQANLLGLSSLLTTTMMEQENVVKALKEADLRPKVKVLVGGGVVTSSWAQTIGADGYAENAQEAVEVGKRLLGVH